MDEGRWLEPGEQRAWRSLKAMQADITQYVERGLRARHGLSTADYEVLVLLSEATGGRLRVFEIGERLRWEKGRLSQHLTRMEGRGLVVRERCTSDQRGTFAVLTPRGRAKIEEAAAPHVADVRAVLLDHATSEQLDLLCELADVVHARVQSIDAEAPLDS